MLLTQTISKFFSGHGRFDGSIKGYDAKNPKPFHVVYCDDDEEMMSLDVLVKYIKVKDKEGKLPDQIELKRTVENFLATQESSQHQDRGIPQIDGAVNEGEEEETPSPTGTRIADTAETALLTLGNEAPDEADALGVIAGGTGTGGQTEADEDKREEADCDAKEIGGVVQQGTCGTDHYLFDVLKKGKWLVDATNKGNVGRFVNHACENNNLKAVFFPAIRGTHPDLADLPQRIALVATRDIARMEELTYDYVPDDKAARKTKGASGGVRCLCGSPGCRSYIWAAD